MIAIVTKSHTTTGRISASNDGRRVYIDAQSVDLTSVPRGMTCEAYRHWCAAQSFIDKCLSTERREILGGWIDGGTMAWVFADTFDRG